MATNKHRDDPNWIGNTYDGRDPDVMSRIILDMVEDGDLEWVEIEDGEPLIRLTAQGKALHTGKEA